MKKLLRKMSRKEIHRLVNFLSVRLKRTCPVDSGFFLMIAHRENNSLLVTSNIDKWLTVELLRQEANRIEKELIESN